MTIPEIHDPAISDNLMEIRQRIEAACLRASRSPDEITLVAVTKFFPAETIRKACALGLAHIGENRVQELVDKFGDGSIEREYPTMCVHLIGHLQANKVRKAVQIAATIDSVDRFDLAQKISHEAVLAQKQIRVLIEVNTSGEPQKFGVSPQEAIEVIEQMLPLPNLKISGLMTIGPNISSEEAIRESFQSLRRLFAEAKSRLNPPQWKVLSMGMSGDYEMAIEEGATEIRLGTALFGPRRST